MLTTKYWAFISYGSSGAFADAAEDGSAASKASRPSVREREVITMPCACCRKDRWIAAKFESFGGPYSGVPIYGISRSAVEDDALQNMKRDKIAAENAAVSYVYVVASLHKDRPSCNTDQTYVYDPEFYAITIRSMEDDDAVGRSVLVPRVPRTRDACAAQQVAQVSDPLDFPIFVNKKEALSFLREAHLE